MGVHGLWKLLEPAGKPVPVETLENKVLGVDVSIWLHQSTRGFQDARGQALPNAHLLGLFHRLCKLLFWRVRPVFVFDGGAPLLKQQTVAARRRRREDAQQRAERARRRLLELQLRKRAVQEALRARAGVAVDAEEGGPARSLPLPPLQLPTSSQAPFDDLFTLPPRSQQDDEPSSAEGEEDDDVASVVSAASPAPGKGRLRLRTAGLDLHSVDVRSAQFLELPADVRHEILTELKETRKQSSWGRLHEMPRESGDFSSYQMARLLQRRSVQESLEAVEKEMGGRSMSLAELEELMSETGTLAAAIPGQRIAADASTRYIFVAAGKTQGAEVPQNQDVTKTDTLKSDVVSSDTDKDRTTEIDQVPETKPMDAVNEYFDEVSDEEISEWFPELDFAGHAKVGSDDLIGKKLKAAHNFIFENSGLTQEQILAVIKDRSANKYSNLDQPSTSNSGCSRNVDHASFKQENKTSIPSGSCVFDMPSTSKEAVSCFPEEKQNNSSIQKREDTIFSSHDPSSTSKSLNTSDSEINETKTESQSVECILLKQNENCNKTTPEEMQSSMDVLESRPSLTFRENEMQSKVCKGQSPSISSVTYCNSSKINLEGSTISVISSQSSCFSVHTVHPSDIKESIEEQENGFEERNSSSSDEDLVEVAESHHTVVTSNVTLQDSTKHSPLQVVIQTSMTDFSEDIFADVFESRTKQPETLESLETTSLHEFGTVNVKSDDLFLHSNFTSEKTTLVENSKQQNVGFSNKIVNIEAKKSISPTSCTSSTDMMIITDNDLNATEEVMKSKVPKENVVDIQTEESRSISTEQLEQMEGSLQEEGNRLKKAQAREERLAASITEQMVQEAQELLQLFGVPYVVAPMEAEAQCAFLDHASLTDGTITDDSDIWLFGGQKVYKNFFDQKKHVLQFRDVDILHSFKLARSQLVLLALLVGSDYTTGLPGVGPVTALEILAAFPSSSKQGSSDQLVDGLRSFREWYMSGTQGRWDKAKLRNKLKDLELSRDFPNVTVVDAYLTPKVDESMEKFSWGTPDVESIKEFARIKFGWSTSKTHEILQPIMKKLNIKITQLSIESYFQAKPKLPHAVGVLSKRVQEAVERIDALQGTDSEEDPSPAKKPKTTSANKNIKKGENTRNTPSTSTGLIRTKSQETTSIANRGRGRGKSKRRSGTGSESQNIGEILGTSIPGPSTSTSVANSLTKDVSNSSLATPCHSKEGEFILQREKDKLNLLKNKLKAIEVFRKSTRGLDKTKRDKKKKRQILSEANLSENSSSDDN